MDVRTGDVRFSRMPVRIATSEEDYHFTPETLFGQDRNIDKRKPTQRPGPDKGLTMVILSKRLVFLIALLVGIAPWVFAQADLTTSHTLLAYSVSKPHGHVAVLPTISLSDLPSEARQTLSLIKQGGPFPYPRDGITFSNREGRLPYHRRGYYSEYTVKTPGRRDRGARRIIAGSRGELYYTDDHYKTFRLIKE